jgi:hypothetical protein
MHELLLLRLDRFYLRLDVLLLLLLLLLYWALFLDCVNIPHRSVISKFFAGAGGVAVCHPGGGGGDAADEVDERLEREPAVDFALAYSHFYQDV